jgi:hypothetical protein
LKQSGVLRVLLCEQLSPPVAALLQLLHLYLCRGALRVERERPSLYITSEES